MGETQTTTAATDPAARIADAIFSLKNEVKGLAAIIGKAASAAAVLPSTATPATPGTTTPPAAPAPAAAWPPSVVTAGSTITLPAGAFTGCLSVDPAAQTPLAITGAGMRATTADGLGGVGAGHRLAWGKGVLHIGGMENPMPPAPGAILVQDLGFVGGGGADNNSDGEAGVYVEMIAAGQVHLLRLAFDGCENGIFIPTGTDAEVLIDRCVFGRLRQNGLADGRSHDFYVGPRQLTVRGSIFFPAKNGHCCKVRGPHLDISGSWLIRNSRWIDTPGGAVVTSSGNTYITPPDCNVEGALGFFDEGDMAANPGSDGRFTSTEDTFYFSRKVGEVIWVNNPNTRVEFINPRIFWIGDPGSQPPQVRIQGPGTLAGTNPFEGDVFTDANRVSSMPTVPVDPV